MATAELDTFPICFAPSSTLGSCRVSIGEELPDWGITHEQAVVAVGERELIVRTAPQRAIHICRYSGELICRIVGAAVCPYAARFAASSERGECDSNSGMTQIWPPLSRTELLLCCTARNVSSCVGASRPNAESPFGSAG
ncbi:hypothetical protein Acid7E03_28170 [Acidisoma sp. 7E03]